MRRCEEDVPVLKCKIDEEVIGRVKLISKKEVCA